MKNYIVTVEETYFDATKFEIGGFYLVKYKGDKEEEYRCILTSVSKSKMYLKYYTKDYLKELILSPSDLTSGKYEIKEVKTRGIYKLLNTESDEIVPLSKDKSEYKDLYYNACDIKTGKCYEIKIGKRVLKGFCSYMNVETINMVIYSNSSHLGCITYDPTIHDKYSDNINYIIIPGEPNIIHNSITNGNIMTINLKMIGEDCVYFKELV